MQKNYVVELIESQAFKSLNVFGLIDTKGAKVSCSFLIDKTGIRVFL